MKSREFSGFVLDPLERSFALRQKLFSSHFQPYHHMIHRWRGGDTQRRKVDPGYQTQDSHFADPCILELFHSLNGTLMPGPVALKFQ